MNIMLLFLSDVKIDRTTKLPVENTFIDTEYSFTYPIHTTNESAIIYTHLRLAKQQKKIDKIIILGSQLVRTGTFLYEGLPITHLEYFKLSLKNNPLLQMSDIDNQVKVYKYEASDSALKATLGLTNIFDNLIELISPDEDINIYADLSGGTRDVNMIMLDILRLLAYKNINICSTMYADYNPQKHEAVIKDITETYDLFNMIAGAEEFKNYGSINAIKSYCSNLPGGINEPLQQLLTAMENFSNTIKMCHMGMLPEVTKQLGHAFEDFQHYLQDNNDAKTSSKLIGQLIPAIKAKYTIYYHNHQENLFDADRNSLAPLYWCFQNGYIQQALTLVTEHIPEYVFFAGLLDDNKWRDYQLQHPIKREDDKKVYSDRYMLFVENDEHIKYLRDAAKDILYNQCVKPYWQKKHQLTVDDCIKTLLNGMKKAQDEHNRKNAGKDDTKLDIDTEKLYKNLNAIVPIIAKNPDIIIDGTLNQKEFYKLLRENLEEKIKKLKSKKYRLNLPGITPVFHINPNTIREVVKRAEELPVNTNKCEFFKDLPKLYEHHLLFDLIKAGLIKTATGFTDDKLYRFCQLNFILRNERNNANHAKQDTKPKTLQEIQGLIHELLNLLESVQPINN